MIFQEYIQGKLINKTIAEFLSVKYKDIISVAGAGGKTTTINLLAKELVDKQQKVLVTTTTKMFKTKEMVIVPSIKLIREKLIKENLVITGKDFGTKITSWDNEFLAKIILLADVTLIESDGAKRLPFKMPKENEPVYLTKSNKIVYIIGLSALNQPLKNLCRVELLTKFLQKDNEEKLTKDDIIKVILSEYGAKKNTNQREFYLIINQVDNLNLFQEAVYLASKLAKYNLKVAISSYKEKN